MNIWAYAIAIGKYRNFHIWWVYDGFKIVMTEKIYLLNRQFTNL